MSWISLDQLVVPVALASVIVAASMLMPAAGGRRIVPTPATWSRAAAPDGTRQAAPGVDHRRRAGSPVGSSVGSPAGVLADPRATVAAGQLAGTVNASVSRSAGVPAPGSTAVTVPGRRGVAAVSVPVGPGRRGGASAGSSAAAAPALPAAAPAGTPVGEITRLRPPVPGRLVRGFDAPASPYGPGHRGVDLAADSGTSVTAPAPGRVRFAGQVGGIGWVSVEIATGVTVSVGPISRFQVRAGDDVGVLTVLGEAAAGHGGAVHLGMRVHGEYVDPQPHLARFGPARLVPLEPTGQRQGQRPRRAPRSVPDRLPEGPAQRSQVAPAGRRSRRRAGALGRAVSEAPDAGVSRSSVSRFAAVRRERTRIV